MEKQQQKEINTSARLLTEIRHLHPNLKFCGEPKNAILSVNDGLLNYVLSLLRDDPVHPPQASLPEWMTLLRALESHWITPLLYWQVCRLPNEFHPPESVLDSMRSTFQWSRARCLQMERQLGEIVTAFRDEGVRVLVLKGPAYGRTVYPDPALRPASDLDLLVQPDQMIKSRTILERLGYKCTAKLFDAGEKLHKDEVFEHRENSKIYLRIDLHWRFHYFLGSTQEVQEQDLFDRAVTVEVSSLVFEALDPVDALIHTAINNVGHDEAMRLIWIHDILLLARKLDMPEDWDLLQTRCVQWKARMAVELSLTMAQNWIGLSLPSEFRDFSTWPRPTAIEIDVWKKIVSKDRSLRTRIKLRLLPGAGPLEKVHMLARLVFPPLDKARMSYPPANVFTPLPFYARRWWMWIKKLRI